MNIDDKKYPNLLLWLVAIGFFMQTLDSTIVNTSLPAMAKTLGESPLKMQSVIVAYSLTMASLIPASGWLADRFGTKRTFFSAILLFSLGSLFCGISQNLTQLVCARVLQGIGGSMLIPVGRLAVLRAFPGEKFLPAINFVTIPAMIGPLLGPTLGGWLSESFTWHWIFLINIPIGVIGCLATIKFMPDFKDPELGRFDFRGYSLLTISMIALSVALDSFSDNRFNHGLLMVLLFFGLATAAAYWIHAAKAKEPLFSLDLFAIRSFSIGLMGNLFARIGSGSLPFLLPLLLQLALGYSPTEAGLMMIPTAVTGILARRYATTLIIKIGYRKVLVANTFLVGLTIASFALVTPEQPLWIRVVQLLIFGAVNSIQFSAMNTITLKDLKGHSASSGNSLLSMVMMLAMSLGVAVAGALVAGFSAHFSLTGDSNTVLKAFQASFVCIGLITGASAWIFWQTPDDEDCPEKEADAVEIA